MRSFYLDYNASTPVHSDIMNIVQRAMDTTFANPSSMHKSGKLSAKILEDVRGVVSQFIHVKASELIFTSGATEAINLAIYSVLCNEKLYSKSSNKHKLLYASTEHKCVINALKNWNKILQLNYDIIEIPVDTNGQVILKVLEQELPGALILCIMAVNNETGIIADLSAIQSTINKANPEVLWLCDSVQAMGKIDIDYSSLGINYAAFSGHKIYAPKGCGVLFVKDGCPLIPMFTGSQENKYRAGTENVSAIAGFGAAVSLLQKNPTLCFDFLPKAALVIRALTEVFPDIRINNGVSTMSVPTVINFSVPGFVSKELIDIFELFGMHVASGSACGALNQDSYVINGMGLDRWISEGVIRMSFCVFMSEDEVLQLCERIKSITPVLNQYKTLSQDDLCYKYMADKPFNVIRFNHHGSNSWVIVCNGKCIIVDPVFEIINKLIKFLNYNALQLITILDTHGHADHQSCSGDLANALGFAFTRARFDSLGWPIGANGFSEVKIKDVKHEAIFFDTNYALIKVLTPGHTADSRTFVVGELKDGKLVKDYYIFTGDNILIDGLGRTNFATSNAVHLYRSIDYIMKVISLDSIICPSHDYKNLFATTLNTEAQTNELMHCIKSNDQSLFLEKKLEIDSLLEGVEQDFNMMRCGIVGEVDNLNRIISSADIKILIYNNKYLIIDVRDSIIHHSDIMVKDINSRMQSNVILNAPYSHITNFILHAISYIDKNTPLIFICNTGASSLYAADAIARLGFNNSYSTSVDNVFEAII